MVKHWNKESSLHSNEDLTSYNAVHYVYKEKFPITRQHRRYDTKNYAKFREVFKNSRPGVPSDTSAQDKWNSEVSESNNHGGNSEDVSIKKEQEVNGHIQKKVKKLKKKKCNKVTVTNESSVDMGSISSECTVNSDIIRDTSSKKNKKHGKKKNKEKEHSGETGRENVVNIEEGESTIMCEATEGSNKNLEKRSKKKKKRHRSADCFDEEAQNVVVTEDMCSPPKGKKRKNKEKKREEVVHDMKSESNQEQCSKDKPSRKKKKKGKVPRDSSILAVHSVKSESNQEQCNEVKLSKKRKKKGKVASENSILAGSDASPVKANEPQSPYVTIRKTKVLKKKKQKRRTIQEKEVNDGDSDSSTIVVPTENNMSNFDEDSASPKKKNKKRKYKGSEVFGEIESEEANLLNNNNSTLEQPSNIPSNTGSKPKRKSKTKEAVEVNVCTPVAGSKKDCSKKRKRRKVEVSEDEEEPNKRRAGDPMLEDGISSVTAGQWGTAQFENKARKGKFLRLMGGTKTQAAQQTLKQVNVKTKDATGKKSNTALSLEQENQLNKGLEKQYDTALNWMIEQKKGCGLGFEKDPAEGKKFHISVNKSSSKKFED